MIKFQSPIGLVLKKGSDQVRLIFHLSYDFKVDVTEDGRLLNHHTPKERSSVHYRDLDYAVKVYMRLKRLGGNRNPVFGGKTDVRSAFRLVPLKPHCWRWLIMKAEDPNTGKTQYFVDKCLPFGASISCAIFQQISNGLKFLIEYKAGVPDTVTNYLDDFLFLALSILACNNLIEQFLEMCKELGIPISLEKTEWGCELVIFLGILLDGRHYMLRIPLEKRQKAVNLLKFFLDKKKATIKQLQELCRYLNFLCKAILPGRAFLRRMYSKYSKIAHFQLPSGRKVVKYQNKPFHHVRLDAEFKNDCRVWLEFLSEDNDLNNIVNRPMVDVLSTYADAKELCFYSDAHFRIRLYIQPALDTSNVEC